MNTIYKYPLEPRDEQAVRMPQGAVVLCAQVQNGQICLWARVWSESESEARTFWIVGTGRPMPESKRPPQYISTVQIDGFVWHIFEKV